eukprot:3914245-Lingulodinium_polyedra.AAC.1
MLSDRCCAKLKCRNARSITAGDAWSREQRILTCEEALNLITERNVELQGLLYGWPQCMRR